MPKTRVEFWRRKFVANVARDERVLEALSRLGWVTTVIWECETRDIQVLTNRLKRFFGVDE